MNKRVRRTLCAKATRELRQSRIGTGDADFALPDVLHQFVENEGVAVGEIALRGVEDFLATGL